MAEPVKRRGRPRGSKNKTPAKPRSTRDVLRSTATKVPPIGVAEEIERRIEERVASDMADAAGNGRDEAMYEPEVQEALQAADELVRSPSGSFLPPDPPSAPPGPHLTKLFIAAVENGYIIRPAYADAYKGAADDRSWVVSSREELARMVAWLMADRGAPSPDFFGGAVAMPPLMARVEPAEAPRVMPQPTAPHYAKPIGLRADETAS